jgi:hypothetical protein
MLQALFSFWANVLVGKCLSGQMPFLGKCLSGQMSFWADVLLGKCLFWANVLLGKRPSKQMKN